MGVTRRFVMGGGLAFIGLSGSFAGSALAAAVDDYPTLSDADRARVTELLKMRPSWTTKASLSCIAGQTTPIPGTDAQNYDQHFYTASLIKLLTLAVVFDEIKQGRLSLDEVIPVSDRAYTEGLWRSNLKEMSVREAICLGAIGSKNDAMIALAERIAYGRPIDVRFKAGESAALERKFARQFMQPKAFALGMLDTLAINASGLPEYGKNPASEVEKRRFVLPNSFSTLQDMAKICTHLVKDHPEFADIFSLPKFDMPVVRGAHRLWEAERRVNKGLRLVAEILNTNPFIEKSQQKGYEGGYPGVVFGKTGTAFTGLHLIDGMRAYERECFTMEIGYSDPLVRNAAMRKRLDATENALWKIRQAEVISQPVPLPARTAPLPAFTPAI